MATTEFRVYKLKTFGYDLIATVYSDATVDGDSKYAQYLRDAFDEMESEGYSVVDNLDSIRTRIDANLGRSGHYQVTTT